MERDDKIKQVMHDLRRALAEAITDSSQMGDRLRQLHREGYSLYLLLGSNDAVASQEAVPVETGAVAAKVTERDPEFRIDGRDLAFLRSIGIDPTRRRRSRRRT